MNALTPPFSSRRIVAGLLLAVLAFAAASEGPRAGKEPPPAPPDRCTLIVSANLGRFMAAHDEVRGRAAIEAALDTIALPEGEVAWIDAGGFAAPEAEGRHQLLAIAETPYRWGASAALARRGAVFAAVGERELLLAASERRRIVELGRPGLSLVAPMGERAPGATEARVEPPAAMPSWVEFRGGATPDDDEAARPDEVAPATAASMLPCGPVAIAEHRASAAVPDTARHAAGDVPLRVDRFLDRPGGLLGHDAARLELGRDPVVVEVAMERRAAAGAAPDAPPPPLASRWAIAGVRVRWHAPLPAAPDVRTIPSLDARDVAAITARLGGRPEAMIQGRRYAAWAGAPPVQGTALPPPDAPGWAHDGLHLVEGTIGAPPRPFVLARARFEYPSSPRALEFWMIREEGRRPRVEGDGRLVVGDASISGADLARVLDDALARGDDLLAPLPDEAFLNGELRHLREVVAAFLGVTDDLW